MANQSISRKPEWLNKSRMADSLGITTQAFDKWGVTPVAKIGRESFYDVRSVLDIGDAYTKTTVDSLLAGKAAKATTLGGYAITDAYTKTEVNNSLSQCIKFGQFIPVGSNPSFGSGVVGSMASITGTIGALQVNGEVPGAPAVIALHRPGAFGTYFGLDTDNQLKLGGWSLGSTSYVIYHAGNFNPASKMNAMNCANAGFADNTPSTPFMTHSDGTTVALQVRKPNDTALLTPNGWSKNADTGEIIQWVEYAQQGQDPEWCGRSPCAVPDGIAGAGMTPVQKLAGLAALILLAMAASFGVAWQVQDWRYDGKLAKQTRQFQTDLDAIGNAATAQARAEQDKRLATEQQLAASDQQHTKELSDAQREQAHLRDRLATADVRLSVLLDATDSASGCDVPAAAGTVGVVHAARRAQLDPAHAQRIIAITDDGDNAVIALRACQAYARGLTR